jgi:hypothetical protein
MKNFIVTNTYLDLGPDGIHSNRSYEEAYVHKQYKIEAETQEDAVQIAQQKYPSGGGNWDVYETIDIGSKIGEK